MKISDENLFLYLNTNSHKLTMNLAMNFYIIFFLDKDKETKG